jgi:protein gp37
VDPSAVAAWIRDWRGGNPPSNVWLGTSVEDQQRADERIPKLLEIPARVRFLSCEPLLGSVDLTEIKWDAGKGYFGDCLSPHHIPIGREETAPLLHWVIAGGESGPKARPCNIAWIRSLVAQCKAAGVPAFVKQLGTLALDTDDHFNYRWPDETARRECSKKECYARLEDRKGGDPSEWPADLRLREFPKNSRRAAETNMPARAV